MELYKIVHPPALTVDVKDADMGQILNLLNQQLGSTIVQNTPTGRGAPGGPGAAAGNDGTLFTLAAENQPFWEIVRQMNQQHPLAIAAATSIGTNGTSQALRLSMATTGPSAPPDSNLKLFDNFACRLLITGNPNTGTWSIRVTGFADPRVKIAQYSQLRITKLTDGAGESLLAQVAAQPDTMNGSSIPTCSFASPASVSQAPGLTQIGELRGSVKLMLVVSEKTMERDLTKDSIEPIEIPNGKMSATLNADTKRVQLSLLAPDGPNAIMPTSLPATPLVVQLLDDQGKVVATSMTSARPGSTVTMPLPANATVSKVRVTFTEKTREMTLPVEWKKIDVSAVLPVQTPVRGVR